MDGYSALDRMDLKILAILQVDGRITNQALAERVALSPSACLARVRRLEADGLIQGYHARLDIERIRPTVTIHGSSDPDAWNPPDDARHAVARLGELHCIGCRLNDGPTQIECLRDLPAERVLAACEKVLAVGGRA